MFQNFYSASISSSEIILTRFKPEGDNSEDIVAQTFVYKVKEEFRKSSKFTLKYSGPRFKIKISTMDRFKGDNRSENVSTMYSVIWLLALEDEKEGLLIYLDDTIGFAGSRGVDEAAVGIVAKTDKLIGLFYKFFEGK